MKEKYLLVVSYQGEVLSCFNKSIKSAKSKGTQFSNKWNCNDMKIYSGHENIFTMNDKGKWVYKSYPLLRKGDHQRRKENENNTKGSNKEDHRQMDNI